MASPRDLFDAGAPEWRIPSAPGAPGQVLTAAAVPGVVAWAASTVAGRPVVSVAGVYQLAAWSFDGTDYAAVVGSQTGALTAYRVVTTTDAGAAGELVETVLTLPGATITIPAGAARADTVTQVTFYNSILLPGGPVNLPLTLYTSLAADGVAGEVWISDGQDTDLTYTFGTFAAPTTLDFSAGGTINVPAVSFRYQQVVQP